MEKEYSVILLTKSGDFMLEKEKQVKMEKHGARIKNPYIINENEKAQKVRAEKIFIPYQSIENVQYGEFKHETIE